MDQYVKFNQDRWNNVSRKKGNPYTLPLTSQEYQQAMEEALRVSLTVGKTVPLEWFDRAKGNKLLGLACGGGQQGPIFAGKGYETTIMDFSQNNWTRTEWLRPEKRLRLQLSGSI